MYLIDTDVLVHVLRGNRTVVEAFERRAVDPKAFSVITYGELLYGAAKSARPLANEARVRRLTELFPVIEVSAVVMETFGSLKAELGGQGRRIDDFDLIIASTAISLNYTLVSGNRRHFNRVPTLQLEDWTREIADYGPSQ